MASPSLLDFDALLAPIPGDNPAGDSLPFAVREKLDEARKEIDPSQFDKDDPLRPDAPKRADLPTIIRVAQETLTKTSKDLLVSARLTEALVKKEGFAGLRDGLQLMRRLLSECWNRMYPDIEDGDLEVRAAPLNWLDDPDRGARFPYTIHTVPLVFVGETGYSWQDWRDMQDGKKGAVTAAVFEKATLSTPYERCQNNLEDAQAAGEELKQLTATLTEKLGDLAPSMSMLKKALEDCQVLADQIVKKKGPPPAPAAPPPPPADEAVPATTQPGAAEQTAAQTRRMLTRADIYRQLTDAATLLQQLEPHSPIPYLLQKAIELGNLPFPKLLKALVRDDKIVKEVNRELGIKEEGEGA
ncbi:MAG: type VI secretion system protein TssA [Planctomycetia bacterium]|nr:type VI secretion system protein TssA [Planctomycetia bacterium]